MVTVVGDQEIAKSHRPPHEHAACAKAESWHELLHLVLSLPNFRNAFISDEITRLPCDCAMLFFRVPRNPPRKNSQGIM